MLRIDSLSSGVGSELSDTGFSLGFIGEQHRGPPALFLVGNGFLEFRHGRCPRLEWRCCAVGQDDTKKEVGQAKEGKM